jgi:hypothetical protein
LKDELKKAKEFRLSGKLTEAMEVYKSIISNTRKDQWEKASRLFLIKLSNPFNPSTIIRYNISQNLHVKLVVYDITGKEVKTLVDETKTAGSYDVEFHWEKYRLKSFSLSLSV